MLRDGRLSASATRRTGCSRSTPAPANARGLRASTPIPIVTSTLELRRPSSICAVAKSSRRRRWRGCWPSSTRRPVTSSGRVTSSRAARSTGSSRPDRPGSGTARWGVLRFMDLTARHRVVGGASMRLRLFSLLSAAALFMLGAVPASATSEGHDYLALGDSVPFGFSPPLSPNDAHNFVGYPEIVAQGLDVKDVNAACPGEATGGFLLLTGTDNVCRPYRASSSLHVE